MKTVRCAIYTRKSSDEGLEQAFNSLDAQREACAAYILSQASEGWVTLPDIYDDGGISGGTLERPALQRMLTEVAAGRVDIIVVYKVDRLTRSLTDFSKLVEVFDAAGTSFVSVTQSFSTTTSMGRLTLNMLLSFAQFEREVTAERIRDKIAASKAKGMWMGGTPPLGYAPDGRTLKVVEEHAALVRTLFDRYLALGSVRLLADALIAEHVRVPVRTRGRGATYGGGWFSRGQLYAILNNRMYRGEIVHGTRVYPGLHPPIIDQATWDRVQALLAGHTPGERRARAASPSLLAGKLVDAEGNPLIAVHASKPRGNGVVRYRYYVSRALHHGEITAGLRIPARELELVVATRIAALFDDPLQLAATAQLAIDPFDLRVVADRCAALWLAATGRDPAVLQRLIDQVRLGDDRIEIDCATPALAAMLAVPLEPGAHATITLTSAVRLTRSGRALRLIQPSGAAAATTQDRALIRLLVKACGWWTELRAGELDIAALAARDGITASYLTRVVRLAFLSPPVVEAILAGTIRARVDAARLTATGGVAASWEAQATTMLPGF